MDGRITRIGVIVVMVFVVSSVGVGQITDADIQTGKNTQSFAVTQGDSCYTIQPLGNGTKSVVSFYGYRGNEYGYSSRGTLDLQVDAASQLFLYKGNGGLSLVLLHGKTNSNSSSGGAVTFVIDGLPVTGGWVVKDDDYRGSNDSFTFNGSSSVVSWSWQGNRTDGGAYQARPSSWDSRIRIEPHFNKKSKSYPDPSWNDGETTNQVERWIVRSRNGEAHALMLYQPITIRPGTCKSQSQPNNEQSTSTEQNTPADQNTATEQTGTPTQSTTDSKPTTTTSTNSPQTTTQSGGGSDGGGSIATGPGFGIGIAILALLVVFVVVFRRQQ